MEAAVLQELVEKSDRVPTPVLDWLLIGQWPAAALSCDVSYPRADYSGLLHFCPSRSGAPRARSPLDSEAKRPYCCPAAVVFSPSQIPMIRAFP